ncbi:MAG: class I SAM-dependent methyltransferase [bacterium]|jgi:uncharacterized protein|nr:class I SAM-dependent methyltransferase [bacterium]
MWDALYRTLRPIFQSPDHILEHVETGVSILDIGCGYGDLCARISERRSPDQIVGLDHDAHKVATARTRYAEKPNLHFEVSNLEDLTEVTQHTVMIIDVLHYFKGPDQIRILRNISESRHVRKIIARDIIKAYHPAYYLNRLHEFIMTQSGRTKVAQSQFTCLSREEWSDVAAELHMKITVEKSGLPFYNDHLIVFTRF